MKCPKCQHENPSDAIFCTPPLYSIDPTRLVDEEVIPPQLVSAVLTEEMMQSPNQLGELSSDVEGLWQAAWAEISTGA